ncbi:PKD domain-containing protein [Candidatus Peregrinibacteria bacterium]|nr:PKD domain-containing protein [Candidatus Peregrinibacteria bacterium]
MNCSWIRKNRLVVLTLAVLMAATISVAIPRGIAAAKVTTDTASQVTRNALSEVTTDTSLAQGGSGLRIPVSDNVKLNQDIVQTKTLAETVVYIVNYATGFLGLIATIVFIAGGVMMVLSGGNEENVTKGRKMMTYAAIGIVVIIVSFSAVRFIAGAGGTGSSTDQTPDGNLDDTATGGGAASEAQLAAFQQQLDDLEKQMQGMLQGVTDLENEFKNLSRETRDSINEILKGINANTPGTIKDAIDNIDQLIKDTQDPAVQATLQKLEDLLATIKDLKEKLTALRDTMPESTAAIKLYDETSAALDEWTQDPISSLKFRRFNEKYSALREAIRKFPVVSVQILAVPAEGNVPLTVTLDGLNSKDPTGGTISQYKWTFLDSKGSEVSLGSDPVVVYTFKDPNTYSIKLRASTSNTDKEGFKTAADGVAFVRVVARPAATQVRMRINGKKVTDAYHVTLQDGQAGLSFDPSESAPALGRVIEKYEWFFGDGTNEVRSTPVSVVHSFQKAGEYNVQLVATDNQREKDSLLVKVAVRSVAAEISVTPEEGDVNTEFHFEGVDSHSDEAVIDKFNWVIYDSKQRVVKESDQKQFKYRFLRPGNYQGVLSVIDTNKKQDKIIKTLKVNSRAPVAAFDWSVPQSNHPNRVQLNATNSYDLDEGDTLTYSWDFNGDGVYEVIDSAEPTTQFEYKKTGEFKAKLQVKDEFGGMGISQKTIPIASILSADIDVNHRVARVGEELTFTAKSDTAVGYAWDFGDEETGNSEATTLTHTYKKKGKYTVVANFFDKDNNDNKASLKVFIGEGDAPMARIDYTVNDRQIELTPDLCGSGKPGAEIHRSDTVRLTGQDSINTDGSGHLLLYDWELGDGEKSGRKELSHRYNDLNIGNECTAVRLVVKDQVKGAVSPEDVAYLRIVNQLPQLTDFAVQASREGEDELLTPAKVQLRAVLPRDPDGTIKKYRWWYYREGRSEEKLGLHNTSAGMTEMVVTASGEPDVVENYHFVLEMVDNDNGVYSSEERFGDLSILKIKNGPNLSPIADFRLDKTTIKVGDSVSLVSTSYDPQGDALATGDYKWDFDGDGTFDDVSSGPQINRKYNTPGEYQIRLKVTHRGLSSSVTHPVFVEPTQKLPQAAFTYQINGTEVSFDAGTSRYDDSLADKTLRYEWDFDTKQDADGNGAPDNDIEATDKVAKHVYSEKIIYRVRLKVKDSQGQEGVVVRDINLAQSEVERKQSTAKSLGVKSGNQPLTALDIAITPKELVNNGTAELVATVMNANNEPYTGDVFFEVVEGGGVISPSPAKASDSKAIAIFTASDKGKVRIQVRATKTIYGDLTENIELTVR